MSDRSRLASLQLVLATQTLLRQASHQTLAEAVRRVDTARVAEVSAADALQRAVDEWNTCRNRAFEPERLVGFAGALNDRNAELKTASQQAAQANSLLEAAQRHHARCEAIVRQVEKMINRANTKARRKSDERTLRSREDRQTYTWTQS